MNYKFEGTPSPWKVKFDAVISANRVIHVINREGISDDELPILSIWYNPNSDSKSSKKTLDANAHLIAAAPEMLEALILIVEKLEGISSLESLVFDFKGEILKIADPAIRKALNINNY